MSLVRSLFASSGRADQTISLADYAEMVYGGLSYPFVASGGPQGNQGGESVEASFQGYVSGAYKSNGIVFACITARQMLFSEARFQFRRRTNGRPGDLFGTAALDVLERPWENGTTGDLLSRALVDLDLSGNFYAVRTQSGIRRLRPDWITIISGSKSGSPLDTEVAGYLYHEGGVHSGNDPIGMLPETVCHFAMQPDPTARHRGMSWLTPVISEILGDRAATAHKKEFFDGGAKLGYVVTLDPDGKLNTDQFERWVATFKAGHEGIHNAYKTLFLTSGADVKTVGADMKQVDFKAVQGAGETRICAAARVPAIIVGVSEGLDAATYSNYGEARRAFADGTLRPLWRQMAAALSSIIDVPANAELWYDDRDIPFLQEDMKDEAEIQQMQAAAIRQLIDAGFDADSVVAAVTAGDLRRLEHSGLFSVQLQPAGSSQPAGSQPEAPVVNGNGNGTPLLPVGT